MCYTLQSGKHCSLSESGKPSSFLDWLIFAALENTPWSICSRRHPFLYHCPMVACVRSRANLLSIYPQNFASSNRPSKLKSSNPLPKNVPGRNGHGQRWRVRTNSHNPSDGNLKGYRQAHLSGGENLLNISCTFYVVVLNLRFTYIGLPLRMYMFRGWRYSMRNRTTCHIPIEFWSVYPSGVSSLHYTYDYQRFIQRRCIESPGALV